MAKPFFYRITAADFLAAVVTVPEDKRAAWVLSLALDMVSGDYDTAQTQFAKDIIVEAGEFSEKKRQAANKRWAAKDMQKDAVHSTAMPVTEAVTVTVTKEPKTISRENKFSADDMKCAEYIFSLVLKLNPTNKKPKLEKWADDIRKMVDIDNRPHRELCETFKWAIEDESFWQGNCLSPKSLRKNYDQLRIKIKSNGSGSFNQQEPKSFGDI